jgi:hypothetical protein
MTEKASAHSGGRAVSRAAAREDLCLKKVGPADPEDAANLAVLAGPDGTMATRTKGTCT